MKTVLLTGASGFIGRHCIKPLLERGFVVHAVSYSHPYPVSNPSVTVHRVNILDHQQRRQLLHELAPTHLLHLAWYTNPTDYRNSLHNICWLEASLAILAEFASLGRRAVFAGSCFEYDLRYGYCNEEVTPCLPSTFYGCCKDALRRVAVNYARCAGLSLAWGRIFYLYGPHEAPSRLVPSVIRGLLKGERVKCTHGRQIRDFMHVEDVADALVALLDSELEGVVNLGSGEPVTVRSVVEHIAAILDAAHLVDFGAITPATDDPPVVVADPTKIRNQLGWQPHWRLNDGLAATIEWWRNNCS